MGSNRTRAGVVVLAAAFCLSVCGFAADISVPSAVLVPVLSSSSVTNTLPDSDLASEILEEIGIIALQKQKLTGSGIRVAVVDTGVDPQVLIPGSVAAVVDLTSEGLVLTSEPVAPGADGTISRSGVVYGVRGLSSQSGKLRVGSWSDDQLPRTTTSSSPIRELDGIKIAVSDRYIPGQYDTVYIDTDRDDDLSDEIPLEKYRGIDGFAPVRVGNGAVALAVADIGDGGRRVSLFFDANGHGTSMASVLTADHPEVSPLAPDASIIAVKAVDSAGESSWDLISRGITAACEQDADVVIVSSSPSAGPSSELDDVLSRNRGVLVVLSAGNRGPGVGTLAALGEHDNLLVVGGYVPAKAAIALNWGSSSFFYPWSSVGPDSDGNVPDALAVAVAPALLPDWVSESTRPVLVEGTSVSAAYAGGVAAVVADGLPDASRANLGARLKRAFAESAGPLPHVTAAEQGHGVIRPERALALAKEISGSSKTRVVYKWKGSYYADAFFRRDEVPGLIPATLDNLSPVPVSADIGLPEWASLPWRTLSVAPVDQRRIALRLSAMTPGLYSDYIVGDDPANPGRELESVFTAVVPLDLGSGAVGTEALLGAGDMHRKFLAVTPGSESLQIELSIKPWGQGHLGTARMYVYDQAGKCVYQGSWVGTGTTRNIDSVDIAFPDAGVWEVVVLCDPALRRSGQDETWFRLDAEVGGVGSAAKTVFAHAGKNPDSVESAVSLWNSGVTFDARPELLVNGENGFLRRGEVRVVPGVSAMLALPRVEPDSDVLYLGVSGPEDPSASISFYLYYLDPATGQWKQVEAGDSSSARSGHIVIADPPPGQYVAYVDAVGVGKAGTTFRWLALSTRPGEPTGSYAPFGLSTIKWDAGATLTVNTKAPAQPGVPPEQYLVVWDAADSALRSVVPIVTEAQGASLLVTYVEGTRIGDTVYTTFRAWDRATMRPVDACVQVNGTWYQMSEGYAVVELDHAELVDLQIRAEYPGMISWTNTPDT